jgi:signal recognition particle receptor subunit beta
VSVYKIIVTGPFNSGKTEFVRSASDIPVILTEKNITTEDRGIKAQTTVAMDFGRVTLDGDTIHVFGTPGQTRFSFMWEILASEMNGFIVLVDSTDKPSFPEASELIRQFSGFVNVPHLVVANKTDLPGAASAEEIRLGTRAGKDIDIPLCSAIDRNSVLGVLRKMLSLLKK